MNGNLHHRPLQKVMLLQLEYMTDSKLSLEGKHDSAAIVLPMWLRQRTVEPDKDPS